jgi:hypothetical protein
VDVINIIPSWAYWLAIGALTAGVGAQQVRVANLKTDLATEGRARATESAKRTQLALDHTVAIGKLQSQHAADQQQKDDKYAQQLHNLQAAGAVARADAQRLRGKLATFTSGAVQTGETDATAGQRARDRLPLVGALLAEGVELEAESRGIIQRRDAEVGHLADQIRIDRAACSGT